MPHIGRLRGHGVAKGSSLPIDAEPTDCVILSHGLEHACNILRDSEVG